MPTTKQYLNEIIDQKKALATNITAKGITASETEKLNTLVPKVAQIETVNGEEVILENFTGNILSEPKHNVLLNFPEANKTITAQLSSKNIIPYPYAETTKTSNGITWTVSSDGTIHVSGTATADSFFKVATITPEFSGKYCFAGTASGGSISTYYTYIYNETDKIRVLVDYGTLAGGSITSFDSSKTYTIYITIVKNTSLTTAKSFKPQLTYGNTLPTYTTYISDFSAISVLACGKNLSHVNSSSTSNSSFNLVVKNQGSYTLSAKITRATTATSGNPRMMLRVLYSDNTADEKYKSISINNGQPKQYSTTITTNPNKIITQIQVIPLNSGVGNLKAENIQVEFGTSATSYEPYQGQTYTPTSSGLVTGITSLSPITNLVTDNPGVIFTSVTGETYKEITPSTGKNAITKVYQPAVTNNIDSNITSENIRKDVSILGVTGDYICNYTYDETTKELVLIL